MNFEQGNIELEKIIKELDSDTVTLDRSIELYEMGVNITKECLEILESSKGKITKIKEVYDSYLEVPIDEK